MFATIYLLRVLLYILFISLNYKDVFCFKFFIEALCLYIIVLFCGEIFSIFFLLFGLFLYGLQFTYPFINIFLAYLLSIAEHLFLNFQHNYIFLIFLLSPVFFFFLFIIIFFSFKIYLNFCKNNLYLNNVSIIEFEKKYYNTYSYLNIFVLLINLFLFILLCYVYDVYREHHTYIQSVLLHEVFDAPLFLENSRIRLDIYSALVEEVKNLNELGMPTSFSLYSFENMLYNSYFNSIFGISWNFDLLSILLVGVTIIIFTLCYIYNLNSYKAVEVNTMFFQLFLYFLLEIILIYFFLTNNLLLFYILFEASLVPTLMLIWFFGKRSRKFFAGYSFIIYTSVGSVLFLYVIVYLYDKYGILDISTLKFLTSQESMELQQIGWILTFLAFAVKIPLVPFHSWLPEAHVEAPTTVSVILAALLLKLGLYGFVKILIPFFPLATIYFLPAIISLSLIGLLYSTIMSFYQIDIKKIIAYSSIAHMSGAVISLFIGTTISSLSFMIMIFSHAIVSSALFMLVGCLYDRYGSRLIKDFGGVTRILPRFSFFCFFFFFSNVGLPGTPNFWSEFYLVSSLFSVSGTLFSIILKIFVVVLFLTAVYSLVSMVKILFGEIKNIKTIYEDLNFYEYVPLMFLFLFSLLVGLYPTNYYTLFSYSIQELKYFLTNFKK